MAILNEDLVFGQFPDGVQAAFVGKSARRLFLNQTLELYKFTGYGVIPNQAGADYSPWWAAVTPIANTPDPGLDGHIAAARAAGQTMTEYARDAFAVMLGWNSLGVLQSGFAKVVKIKLTQDVVGFGGLCQRMREAVPAKRVKGQANRSPLAPPIFAGGAYQLYIPNLTAAHVIAGGTYLIP